MSAIEVPDQQTRTVRFRWVSVIGALVAAALFLGSGGLQLVASLQRWVAFRASLEEPISAEDHLYDYSFAWDPWVPVGTAAELLGIGVLLMAIGVLAMPLGVLTWARAIAGRRVAVVVVIVEFMIAILVAYSFAVYGAHALLSGLAGEPSPLRDSGGLGWISVFGLLVLTVLWVPKSRAAMIASVFLLGSTGLGYLIAAFVIAPILAGGPSHDTTPWTETVIAASTAAAGVAMLLTAWMAARRREPRAAPQG
jgi:hypothetical protein